MKTTFKYDHYYKYDELTSNLEYFAKEYPSLVKLESICATPEKRNVWAVTLSSDLAGALNKPALYIDGNTHAGEVTGSMAAMHTLDYLVSNYNDEPKIKQLIDNYTIYFIPRISPDGAETYLATPYSLRSVNREYNVKKQSGLVVEDLDNDGIIRIMRFKSKYGTWKIDPSNPMLMVKRQPDEIEGEFYHLVNEGQFDDFDNYNIKKAPTKWGLDFNRNYPFGWFGENRQAGAGAYPLSNPENKAVVDFVLAHYNIGGVATHHTSGGVILMPPGTRSEKTMPYLDKQIFTKIGAMGTEEMGYEAINIFDAFMSDQANYDSGAFDDWCYQTQGIIAYTIELWNLMERCGHKIVWNSRKEKDEKTMQIENTAVYNWCMEHAKEAFLPWTPYKHPKLGDVEIGGFDYKFTNQNCPPSFLLAEVEKTTKFSLRFLKTLPMIELDNFKANKIGEDLYEIEASVVNKGFLPTYISNEATNLKVAKPLSAKLIGDNVEFINCESEVEWLGLEGYCSDSSMYYATNFYMDEANDIAKTIKWVIKAKTNTSLTINVNSQKAGVIKQEIKL